MVRLCTRFNLSFASKLLFKRLAFDFKIRDLNRKNLNLRNNDGLTLQSEIVQQVPDNPFIKVEKTTQAISGVALFLPAKYILLTTVER